jgi:hypothetical protein
MKALDKSTAVVGTVHTIAELPSKNKDWDSRWQVTLKDGYSFYVGNKALTQQVGRLNLEPSGLVGKHLGFERTEEGYLNIVLDAESFRPGTKVVHGKGEANEEAAPNPNRFDGASTQDLDFLDAVPAVPKANQLDAARQNAVSAMAWAMDEASAMVRTAAGIEEGEVTPPELMRSVVALAATLHITVKGNANGR